MSHLICILTILSWCQFSFCQTNKVSMANNDFAVGMYQQISNSPGNFLFSPFSIEAGLAMASAGAQKETLTQMLQTLHLPANSHAEFTNLLKELKGLTDTQLLTANRIWGRTGGDYSPSFLQSLHENYGADLSPLDFMKDAAKSRLQINAWVQAQTKDKIKDLLPQESITPHTDLVITNAIYFKGSWLSEFKKELSKHDHFYTSATQKKMIPFMHQSSEFRYAASEELQLLEMSYRGNELAMDIILPKTGIDLAKIEKKNEDPHDQ